MTGKTLGTDLRKGKFTLPVLIFLRSASEFERERCCRLVLEEKIEEMTELLKNGATNGALNESITAGSDLIREAQGPSSMGSRRIHIPMRSSRWARHCAKCSTNFAFNEMWEGPWRREFYNACRGVLGRPPVVTCRRPKIREMPQEERPREKLAARGVDALSDAELIAVLLRTGLVRKNVVEVARDLLKKYGSLEGASRCGVRELQKIDGIGPTKALELVAAFGLGNRLARQKMSKQKIDSPELVHELIGAEMRMLHKESLRVILLDTRYHLIRVEEVSVGSVNESIAHPRDVFRPAVVSSAYAVIVVHNHPSGDASPSQTDHSLTRRLAEAAELLQIKLLDHIIIGAPTAENPGYFSFKEAGVL